MKKCTVCNTNYTLKHCTACDHKWCLDCAKKGRGHYPKQHLESVCPYCGKDGKIERVNPHTGTSRASTNQGSGCAAVVAFVAIIPALMYVIAKI